MIGTRDLLLIYLIIMNLITFLVYGWDKYKAIHGKFRISERTLFTIAIVGGSIGALAGMLFFHHKIRKLYFKIGIPAIILMQIAVGIGLKV